MNYTQLFHSLHPGFFQEEGIRTLPKEWIFTELVMDLKAKLPNMNSFDASNGIVFDEYHGDLAALHDAVCRVDGDWVQYFNEGDRVYCAFEEKKIVAFCGLTDMGRVQGLHIGGPGCVGTLPEFRRQGIGLEMVRLATDIFRQEGFDLSWIHYTHLAPWYQKLGYQPVLQWNSDGLLTE